MLLSFAHRPLYAHHGPKWIEPGDVLILTEDLDNDGIFDARESMIGTNPRNKDSDGDGYGDLFEDNYRLFGFDPLVRNVDSDNDGVTDSFERELGTSPENQDTDNDRLSDFDEVLNQRFGYDPVQENRDRDFDGLTDRLERRLRTSPRNPDSNEDGISDFEAYYEGIHPRVKFEGHFGEIIGTGYSSRMHEALEKMRAGADFPSELAVELPYPAITQRLYGSDRDIRDTQQFNTRNGQSLLPSSALMQSGMAAGPNIPYITALYPSYNQIVDELKDIASAFDGSSLPNIVRLFHWSEPTEGHRRIYALKISGNPNANENEPEMLIMGLHHGRELITASYTLELIKQLTNGYAADPSIQSRVNNSEIWIIPVVNPDGYAMAQSEFSLGADVNWRKNIRKVLEPSTEGKTQTDNDKGVDPNRNYDFTHIRTLSVAQRMALGTKNCGANGVDMLCEGFKTESGTYAGGIAFSDVEARSVRMLADNQFMSGDEIDSLRCSLSWHTGIPGAIIPPFNHDSPVSISPQDKVDIDQLGNAYANATGYFYFVNGWWTTPMSYQTFGSSDDWLYTHNGILPLTVEAYPAPSGTPNFFPETAAKKIEDVENNVDGAMAFMNACALIP